LHPEKFHGGGALHVGDPYDIPSEDQVRRSGAGDWMDEAVRAQEEKNRSLSGLLGGVDEDLKKRKQELASLMSSPPPSSPELEEEPAPDLFGSERAQQERKRKSLEDLLADERQAREDERKKLSSLFGEAPRRKPDRR
jgi:hypothetical protein